MPRRNLKKPEELAKAHAALQRIGEDHEDSDLEGLDFDESLYMDDSDEWAAYKGTFFNRS